MEEQQKKGWEPRLEDTRSARFGPLSSLSSHGTVWQKEIWDFLWILILGALRVNRADTVIVIIKKKKTLKGFPLHAHPSPPPPPPQPKFSGFTWHSSFGSIFSAYWKITLTRSCCELNQKEDIMLFITVHHLLYKLISITTDSCMPPIHYLEKFAVWTES